MSRLRPAHTMLGKRKASRYVAPVKKRRKGEPVIEEITFDFDAREDYLTGFHKRKLQRIKHAKEEASKREREERIASRKALRENRKAELQEHVEAVNAAVRVAENGIGEHEDGDSGGDSWVEIDETPKIDHEDDYLDEDRHTVVTVEAVDVSRDGLQKRENESDGDSDGLVLPDDPRVQDPGESNSTKDRRSNASQKPDKQPKKRKKKFRYESKAERKVTRFKEKSGSKTKAKARRGQ
ncbi:MAG: hypothetical protein Q9218_006030 [Villophora microphyllina]